MNDDFLKSNDDDIGIDPTTLDIIESLDDSSDTTGGKKKKKTKVPKEKKEKKVNPDAKPGDGLKKFLLIFLIIALIGGVGFGVYYYLNLGTTNNGKNKDKKFTLNEVNVTIGDILSDKVTDYGTFQVDIKTCTLETDDVDTSKVGDYSYSVTCGDTKYSSLVHVLDVPTFDIQLVLAVTTVGEKIDVNNLFVTSEDYKAEVIDEETFEASFETPGLKKIDFLLYNEFEQRNTITGYVYVFENSFDDTLTCVAPEDESDKYALTDTMYFDASGNKTTALRNYAFDLEGKQIKDVLDAISDTGRISYEGASGFALLNEGTGHLDIVNEVYDSTPGTTKSEIKDYYTNTKNYTCN